MTFTRIFIFLFSLIFTTKAWSTDTTPLVYIYCDYVTSAQPTVEDSEKGWAELVRHFERRELITQKNALSESPKFQECVRKNSSMFETGEFIFEGKSRIQESLGVLQEKRTQGPTLISSDFTVADNSLVGEYFSVVLESKEGAWAPVDMEKDMRERQARYTILWNNFLDSVRDELPNSKSSISLK